MKQYKFLPILVVILFSASLAFAGIESTIGGSGTAKNYRWKVEDGDIVPADDSTYDIGETDAEVQSLYVDTIVLGGVSKSSFGSVISPFEDDGTTTTLTSAPTKFILTHATGVSSFTGYIAGTGDVVLENGQIVDGGTDETIKLTENSDTLSIGFDGTDISLTATDGSIELIPETDATEGTIDLMAAGDTDDYIQISTTTNQPLINFVGCDGSITASGGDISFGDENIVTTGTLGAGASSLGAVTATSFIISDDTLDVVVDDQLRFASNDEETTIEALGYTGKDAVLQLTTDLGADAGDKIQLVSDHATNSLFFTSDTAVKDTHATILTLSKVGIITTTGDVQVVNDSATTDAVQDVLKLTSSSTGTGAAGLGAGVVFHIDDIGGIEEQASIDVALTTATDGAEDTDVIISQNTAGAIAETLRIVAASAADASDYLQFTANTTETNAATNVLVLKTATGTAADNYGMSISFQPEDATGSEEVASLDIIQTTAARATNDTDFVFSQNLAGAIEERVRFDADSKTISAVGTTPIISVGDGGNEDNTILFDGQTTKDFYIATDNADDSLIIGVGSTVGTDSRITVQDSATETRIELGDAVTAEDIVLVLDGNAQDFYIALDDTDDDLKIGVGAAVDTTPAITILSDTQIVQFEKTVTFTGGQTKSVIYTPNDVTMDGTVNPGTTDIGTTAQARFDTLGFDADTGATGDDWVFINWIVPAGYVTDSGDLNVYWSYSTAEDAGDEITIDGTVNAVAAGEAIDAAGTAMTGVASVIADASTGEGKIYKTSLDIEVEEIVIGDLVCIGFFVDESASLMANSGTADVHWFEITYESTE